MRIDFFETMQLAKKKYAQIMEPVCSQWNLTRNELDVLLFLHNNPEHNRAADIVIHRGMAKSHVSLSVTTLESKGLLQRSMNPEDRRAVHLTLSSEGHQIAEQGRVQQQEFFTKIYAGLSREDFAIWQQITEKVCRNIENLEEM